jgi:hypothetical protein
MDHQHMAEGSALTNVKLESSTRTENKSFVPEHRLLCFLSLEVRPDFSRACLASLAGSRSESNVIRRPAIATDRNAKPHSLSTRSGRVGIAAS